MVGGAEARLLIAFACNRASVMASCPACRTLLAFHWFRSRSSREGDLKSGKGAMSTPQSGLFAEQNYSLEAKLI